MTVRPRRSARRAWVIALVACAALGAYVAWDLYLPLVVEARAPTHGSAVRVVYATGTVEPTVMLPIAPRVAGRILELRVDEGAMVKKDQVLARLEDADLERSVEEMEARARFAEESHRRAETLLERGLGPMVDRDRARSEWQAAEAALARARALREFMWLKAPADGQVLRRDGEVGQLIPVNQPVFHMACCAGLRISAQVDEEDIALVRPGQAVVIRADAFPDRVLAGEVAEITPMGDPVTRTYRVRIGLVGETPLRIGMTTDSNIVVAEHHDAMLLPATAIGDGHVWLIRDGRLVRQAIETGIVGGLKVEVLSGLDDTDLVVTMPRASFTEGVRVRAQRAVPAQQPEE
jgi:RND family efflux transporter MFP subunit